MQAAEISSEEIICCCDQQLHLVGGLLPEVQQSLWLTVTLKEKSSLKMNPAMVVCQICV